MDWKVPEGMNNTSNLYAMIDPGNTITEIHEENNIGFIPLKVQGTTGISDESKYIVPALYKLEQNYPNPFNPATTIKYLIPESGLVTLKVYDILGREIVTLVDDYKPAGKYKTEFNARSLPSGVYFYKIQAGSFVETKKMILLK